MAVEAIDGKAVPATPENLTNGTSKLNGSGVGDQLNVSSSSLTPATPSSNDLVPCENCGKLEQRGKLKKKRFCTLACARLSKTSSTDNLTEDDKLKASPSLHEKIKTMPATPTKMDVDNSSESGVLPIEEHVMLKWSVTEVCDFIKNLPGCSDYAEDFMMQEIDGQALLLLKENHLVSAMGMKLGPALKIVNKIESMRVSNNADQLNQSTPTPPSPAP